MNGQMTSGQVNGNHWAGDTRNAQSTKGPTLIGETTDDIAAAAKRVFTAVIALREFNDGINGSQPRVAEGGDFDNARGLPPSIPPRGDRLRNETRSLNSALLDLESEISRLDRI